MTAQNREVHLKPDNIIFSYFDSPFSETISFFFFFLFIKKEELFEVDSKIWKLRVWELLLIIWQLLVFVRLYKY